MQLKRFQNVVINNCRN